MGKIDNVLRLPLVPMLSVHAARLSDALKDAGAMS